MADIPTQSPILSETNITKLNLGSGPHSFTYNKNEQVLNVDNREVGSVTVTLSGDNVTTVPIKGMEDQSLSAGYAFVVPTLEHMVLVTSDREKYLGANGNNVVVTVTGAGSLSDVWLTAK